MEYDITIQDREIQNREIQNREIQDRDSSRYVEFVPRKKIWVLDFGKIQVRMPTCHRGHLVSSFLLKHFSGQGHQHIQMKDDTELSDRDIPDWASQVRRLPLLQSNLTSATTIPTRIPRQSA